MSEVNQRQWSDLPSELISEIAERLGPVEVVRFRSVCQAWNSASSVASAKIESVETYEPWFIHYGFDDDSDQCQLVTTENGIITMSLPQLDATTTCIASYQGWLLVFKQGGSMFFFHPFSKTKIDIPKFPYSELSDHVAAFSSPPTSADCAVCLIRRSTSNDDQLDLNLLRRGGGNEWKHYKIDCPQWYIDIIKYAGYGKIGEFYFFDDKDQHISFKVPRENKKVSWHAWTTRVTSALTEIPAGAYYRSKTYFTEAEMLNKLGLPADEDVLFSICGTQTELNDFDKFIFDENYEFIKTSDHPEESKRQRKFKGVWIYPRFYQTSLKEQRW
ncbi:uncharacterized protein LOC126784162 [Argentina anserina]|uniref:uncharacterized protein LOC126784162 n=1 Tax=Argentina anserina TaxID=57926 RepID=UPI00217677D5|nr:uncharacterized protein LOC126784162 [Potentilla anserina]